MPLDSTPLLFATPQPRRPLRADFSFDAIWWHAGAFTTITTDPASRHGGFHLGTFTQASQRQRPGDRLHAFRVTLTRDQRHLWRWSSDCGEGWDRVCTPAHRKGYKAIVYLNRFEGLDAQMHAAGHHAHDFDDWTDTAFRATFPDASWSLIVMDPSVLIPLSPEDTAQAVQTHHPHHAPWHSWAA